MLSCRSLLAVFVCMAGACTSPRSVESLRATEWPQQLSLLRWRAAPKLARPGPGVGLPAGSAKLDIERDARTWLLSRFDGVQDVELQVTAHDEYAVNNAELAHSCVVIMQTWRGLHTDRVSVVYVSAERVAGQYLAVGSFEVVPDTLCPALPESAVRRTIAGFFPSLGIDASHAAEVTLHLRYVWQDGDEQTVELRPVWIVGDGPFLVDARTGVPGRDG
jgi:hypothetical protein